MSGRLYRFIAAGAFLMSLPVLPGIVQAGTVQGIDRKALLHDTHNLTYRSPFGAVPAGTSVKLTLRTAHRGASSVILHTSQVDDLGQKVSSASLAVGLRRIRSGKTYDLWQETITPRVLGILSYSFEVRKAKARVWYSSTALQQGGPGQAYGTSPDLQFKLTVYDSHFATPGWMRDAVLYQIFPDRFYDGDPSNNIPYQATTSNRAAEGTCPAGSYDYEGWCTYTHTDWSQRPEQAQGTDHPATNTDFFGGDLQGIIDKIPYLKSLGVNVLYLNPIFQSPSNHKYDTSDYMKIDPHFGTLETFQKLVETARGAGIRIVLDGVFSHTGADSVYFNKYGHFPDAGAYQSRQSPYYPWYAFFLWPDGYETFGGHTTLPKLTETDAVKSFFFRKPDSVAQHWLAAGAAGWRLDTAQDKSGRYWRDLRQSVKAAYPDTLILAEDTALPVNATPYLLGNQMDGVMNYRFREAVTRYFAGGVGSKAGTGLKTTSFYHALTSILEDYPLPAIESSMNLVDSHDTERILYDLGGDKQTLRQVVALQMTWVGAPAIYYGDEAGLTGATDPDDRRTFPWGAEDTALQSYYRTVIAIRAAHPALRDGTVTPLVLDNAHQILAYLRRDRTDWVAVVMNGGPSPRSVTVSGLPSGAAVDALTHTAYTVTGGKMTLTVGSRGVAILTPSSGASSHRTA